MAKKKKSSYHSDSHRKYSLKAHIIFVVKYRKKLLVDLGEDMKQIFFDISQKSDFTIENMEVDKDHIHILVDYKPHISISAIINRLKSMSTKRIWDSHETYLKEKFWKDRIFWTSGNFSCSVGEACLETIQAYIDNQG